MRRRNLIAGGAGLAAVGTLVGLLTLSSAVIQVPAGADLQGAINAASTGDTLQLADATYTGNFVDNKGLTIRGPAKIVSPNADPTISHPPGTPPAVLQNLEITTTPSWPQVFSIIRYGDGGPTQDTFEEQPQGLTIDNVWVHGHPGQEVQRCVAANGRNFKFLNSRATDCHGRGYDSQAIATWNGSGPFTILDSYLEGAGENVMFGGSPPSIPNLVHTGIEVRRNYFFKPLNWKGAWTVKNLFELKNARNVVVDGNIFENNWTDAQAGWAIQFTPRPSDSGSAAVVEDVQFTNNVVRNSDQGINILGRDQPPAPTDTRLQRVRIANNLFDKISGTFVTITNGADTVTIENNTAIHGGNIISSDYAPSTNLVYRNNVSRHNNYGIFGSGRSPGNDSLNFYFPGAVVTGNQIAKEVGAPGNVESIYPSGNSFPASLATVINPTTFRSLVAGVGADMDAIAAAQGGGSTAPSPTATATATLAPSPTGESPNGTRLPPATAIVDSASDTWTRTPAGTILRNGGGTGGAGSQIAYCNQVVNVFGTDSRWYKWNGGWVVMGTSDPCGGAPSPTATPTATGTPTPAPLPSPTATATAQPTAQPTATPIPPCQSTSWPSSIQARNQRMAEQRALRCYPVRQPSNNSMEYARP